MTSRADERSADVIVVGGGVMGCASAYALARRGVRVVVLERSVPGAEASSAAAGMLGAQAESHAPGPFASLSVASRERFGPWAQELRETTGIDVEHRECGILQVARDERGAEELARSAAWQRNEGFEAELLDARAALAMEPSLGEGVAAALHFPRDGRIDPPRLLRALRIAAERAGVRFKSGTYVKRIVAPEGRARGVELEGGTLLEADHVVVAAGSWSTLVGGVPLESDAVRPARGQIVELLLPAPVTRGVISDASFYLSPRDDGRVLIGSTLEFVGYERATTAGAIRDLLTAATRAVPALERADFSRAWSSFRPHTAHGLPFIGRSSIERVWLATGHFRNGILLSPITAEIIAALVTGEAPPVDPSPFEAPRG
jgi:glycine oxidase